MDERYTKLKQLRKRLYDLKVVQQHFAERYREVDQQRRALQDEVYQSGAIALRVQDVFDRFDKFYAQSEGSIKTHSVCKKVEVLPLKNKWSYVFADKNDKEAVESAFVKYFGEKFALSIEIYRKKKFSIAAEIPLYLSSPVATGGQVRDHLLAKNGPFDGSVCFEFLGKPEEICANFDSDEGIFEKTFRSTDEASLEILRQAVASLQEEK